MANKEHVAILKQGIEVWNEWKKENPYIKPDLSMVDLNGVNLGGAYLRSTNLSGVHLSEAILFGAILRQANLSGAHLIGTDLSFADLSFADLSFADLSYSRLTGAVLLATDLSQADLSRANLRWANLHHTKLNGANWTKVEIGYATFGNVNLCEVKGLETVKHIAPSTIGIDTVYQSGGNIPDVFLRGAGAPDNFITLVHSLAAQAFDFYSCFISHSSKDREFVERLYADLQSNGVRCWYAPEDLKIGEPFLLGIDQGIRLHDKLLLVLSENSVGSGWVQHEVLSAMAKEQGKAPWMLFPIRLDNAVMETGVSWANMIRQSRHIGDFTRWKDHDSYRKAFDKLLSDLKGKS